MNLQKIKSLNGQDEYVLLPVAAYQALKNEIEAVLSAQGTTEDDYVPFVLDEYVDNPVALARIKARLTQTELSARMKVSQAYISKIERQDTVTLRVLDRVKTALTGSAGVPPAS